MIILGICIIFNIVFNLTMAILVEPGNTDQFKVNYYCIFNLKNYTATDLEKIVNPNKVIKICNVCNAYKPDRAHHCSIC